MKATVELINQKNKIVCTKEVNLFLNDDFVVRGTLFVDARELRGKEIIGWKLVSKQGVLQQFGDTKLDTQNSYNLTIELRLDPKEYTPRWL